MPKFSCTNAFENSWRVRRRTSGCMRWPPLWISCTELRSKSAIAGSLMRRISSAGTTFRCVARCFCISANISAGPRVVVQDHGGAMEHEALDAGARQRQVVRDGQHQQQHRVAAHLRDVGGDAGL